jgi:hypothetical protein
MKDILVCCYAVLQAHAEANNSARFHQRVQPALPALHPSNWYALVNLQ